MKNEKIQGLVLPVIISIMIMGCERSDNSANTSNSAINNNTSNNTNTDNNNTIPNRTLTSSDSSTYRPVRYQKVYLSDGYKHRTFAGVTQSGVQSHLSFRVPGTVENLLVKVGDKINQGDVIAELDAKDYRLNVQEAEASLSQAQAQERLAAATYARIRDLFETYSTSRNELDAARAQSESASAAVEAMENKLNLIRSQLSYTILRAPIAGSVAGVRIEKNENVASGIPVITLNSGANLEVKVSIPEFLISQVHTGQKVQATFDSIPGKTFAAVVTEVGINGAEGATFPVTVELSETPDNMRAGMAAEVQFSFSEPESRMSLYVPSSSVIGQGASQYVYVLKPDRNKSGFGSVEKRKVNAMRLTGNGLEIVAGLNPDELVVTAGVSHLKDGQRVKVEE